MVTFGLFATKKNDTFAFMVALQLMFFTLFPSKFRFLTWNF